MIESKLEEVLQIRNETRATTMSKAYITILDCESIGEKTEADERSTFDGDGLEIL